jgi:hypothetical protein
MLSETAIIVVGGMAVGIIGSLFFNLRQAQARCVRCTMCFGICSCEQTPMTLEMMEQANDVDPAMQMMKHIAYGGRGDTRHVGQCNVASTSFIRENDSKNVHHIRSDEDQIRISMVDRDEVYMNFDDLQKIRRMSDAHSARTSPSMTPKDSTKDSTMVSTMVSTMPTAQPITSPRSKSLDDPIIS